MSKIDPTKKSINAELEQEMGNFRKILSDLFRSEARKSGQPLSHLDVLAFVTDKKEPSMRDIADHLAVTPPSATVMIEKMIRKKLLSRLHNPKDRRSVKIRISPAGEILIKKLKNQKKQLIHAMLDSLSESEKKQFLTLIKKIVAKP